MNPLRSPSAPRTLLMLGHARWCHILAFEIQVVALLRRVTWDPRARDNDYSLGWIVGKGLVDTRLRGQLKETLGCRRGFLLGWKRLLTKQISTLQGRQLRRLKRMNDEFEKNCFRTKPAAMPPCSTADRMMRQRSTCLRNRPCLCCVNAGPGVLNTWRGLKSLGSSGRGTVFCVDQKALWSHNFPHIDA